MFKLACFALFAVIGFSAAGLLPLPVALSGVNVGSTVLGGLLSFLQLLLTALGLGVPLSTLPIPADLSALSTMPPPLLSLLVDLNAKLNLKCETPCICIDCVANPDLISPNLDDVQALLNPVALAAGTETCPLLQKTINTCLLNIDLCYSQCGVDPKICDGLLLLCLYTEFALYPPTLCGNSPVIELVVNATLDVDLCALFKTQQKVACEGCLAPLPAPPLRR
jgi:hypothetical protein